ncbi:MAG: flagellar basal body protein [Acidobacteria bacterium]|nr:flagellar basal body protein [Acidobacteriota bacterium]
MLGTQTLLLARYMDLLSARQQVTALNVANADTPGYKTRDIDFAMELAAALDNQTPEQPPPLLPHEIGGLAVKNDGNDVSLDRELRLLGETVIRYQLVSMLARGNIDAVRSAIHEGRNG